MRVLQLLFFTLAFNISSVFSKHHKHESLGLRGNQGPNKFEANVCKLHCEGNNTLPEKIHCSLNQFLENRTNISGTIYFTSGIENSSYSILENNSKPVTTNENKDDSLELVNTTESIIDYSIFDFLANGSLADFESKGNDTVGNFSINSLFLDTEDSFLAEFDKFSSTYKFENIGQKEIVSDDLNITLISSNKTIESNDKIDLNQELIDEMIREEFNTTVEVLEEISESFPDLRELTDIVKGEKNVSVRELLYATSRLMRSLNAIDENISDIDDNSFEKLRERLSDNEIEKLKAQHNAENSTIVKQPWYAPLKKLGINIISGKNTIFSAIISIIESVIGLSPVGSIVSIVVRVIAAIVTIVHDIIQRRKSNSNLIRVLRSLDDFETSDFSKVSLANKLIDRIFVNAGNINESQSLLRELYKDLSELAFNAEKNLYDFKESIVRDQLNKIISGKLASMSNNSTINLQDLNQDRFYNKYGSNRLLMASSSIIRSDLNKRFSVIADEIEEYLNNSFDLSWEANEFTRNLNGGESVGNYTEVIDQVNSTEIVDQLNSTDIVDQLNSTDIVTTTTTSSIIAQPKVKWYDGLIQFSKKVTELSGVVAMLDMLLELFTVVFGNSSQAESILSVLRLIVYLIKSVFNIFGNISSNRKLIDITRVIPEKIASDSNLLQLTMRKIKENQESAQLERDIIKSQIKEIIKVSEPDYYELIDQEFDEYLTYNDTENIQNENKLRKNASVETRIQVAEYYLMHERLLSASESTAMATELNFKSWMEKVGSFFDSSYEKIKQVIKSIFMTIFKGNKIVAFIDKLIDLIISVIRSIYHAFKNKSTQRLLIQSIEECEEQELQEILQKQLEHTLKNENIPIMNLLY